MIGGVKVLVISSYVDTVAVYPNQPVEVVAWRSGNNLKTILFPVSHQAWNLVRDPHLL